MSPSPSWFLDVNRNTTKSSSSSPSRSFTATKLSRRVLHLRSQASVTANLSQPPLMNLELRNDLQSRPSSGISVILSALTAAKLNRDQASSTASSLHLRRSAPPRILKSGHLSSNLQLLSVMPRPIPSSIAVVSSHRCSSSPSCSEPVMVSTVVDVMLRRRRSSRINHGQI